MTMSGKQVETKLVEGQWEKRRNNAVAELLVKATVEQVEPVEEEQAS